MDFLLAIDIDDARLSTQYAEFGDLLRTHLGARFGRRHPPQPGSSVVPLNGTRRTMGHRAGTHTHQRRVRTFAHVTLPAGRAHLVGAKLGE